MKKNIHEKIENLQYHKSNEVYLASNKFICNFFEHT